ncbi:MAG: glycosyltransferase family 2 protein [Chloroflexi bacterium]|nr:glycosyltransferase family 2 protein [Chloroflexota bacterium]
MDVSIAVIAHRHREMLRDCLRSIQAFTHEAQYEIVVVDNAANDGSAEMLAREFPFIRVIRNKSPRGYATNCNAAIVSATGRYVLVLNDDVVVLPRSTRLAKVIFSNINEKRAVLGSDVLGDPEASSPGPIDEMVRFMDQNLDVGMAGPMIVGRDGEIQPQCARSFPSLRDEFFYHGRLNRLFPRSRLTGRYLMTYWDHRDSRDVDLLLGACMLVRRETIQQIGLLDERFRMYAEDVDWCYRAKKAGWRIRYLAEQRILHYGGQSTGDLKWFVEGTRSIDNYYRKHYTPFHGLIYRGIIRFVAAPILLIKHGILKSPLHRRRDVWFSCRDMILWRSKLSREEKVSAIR